MGFSILFSRLKRHSETQAKRNILAKGFLLTIDMWQRGQVANQVLNIHIWPDDPNNYQPHPFSLPYQTHPGFRQEGIRLNGSPRHWIYIWDPNNPYFGNNFQEWLERTLQVHAPGPWHANGGE